MQCYKFGMSQHSTKANHIWVHQRFPATRTEVLGTFKPRKFSTCNVGNLASLNHVIGIVYMSLPDVGGLPPSNKMIRLAGLSHFDDLHARKSWVGRPQTTAHLPVDTQENDHSVPGSNDVHLTTDTNQSLQTKIIQRANYISMQYNIPNPLISTPPQADARQANSLENVS